MEAPKKVYLYPDDRAGYDYEAEWGDKPWGEGCVEYTRTDAFVEKACKAFCKVCKMPNCNSKDCSYLKDFRNHVKGE